MTAMLPGLPRLSARLRAAVQHELVVDNFAGAGGASLGIEAALGRCVDIAINHNPKAVTAHRLNHPNTRHLCEDVWDVDPLEATGGRPVGLAWFSPDCKHFSKAKGGKPLSKNIRGLAWVVVKWAKAVKPRIIILENVEEFVTWGPLDAAGNVIKAKKGQTFLRWVAMLRNLGYEVEHRELVAADYGVPTTRKRFFLIARCDGLPIVWPETTHAPRKKARALGKKPWRAAAECIDWTLPCPSIFERSLYKRRPLAEATMRRIARGLVRYVINATEPFIVTCNHGGATGGLRAAGEPMRTVTGSRDANGVVVPFVAKHYSGVTGHGVERPIGAVTSIDHHSLVETFLQRFNYGEAEHVHPADPAQTVVAGGNHHAVVAATLMTNTSGHAATDLESPAPTLTSGQQQAVVGATLVQTGYGEREGQQPRVPGLDKPLGTVVGSNKHALAGATLVHCAHGEESASGKRWGAGEVDPAQPLPTLTASKDMAVASAFVTRICQNGSNGANVSDAQAPLTTVVSKNEHCLSATHLSKFYGNGTGQAVREPMPTITGQYNHIAEVRAFLVKYYGSGGQDADCRNPMHTLTAKARMGLVTVAGEEFQITDIGLRMLEPRELLRAQFGRFAGEYILQGTKADQVAAIGNSVCPELAEAIVRANLVTGSQEPVAGGEEETAEPATTSPEGIR